MINEFRAIHDSGFIILDDQMSLEAEKYAAELASVGSIQHSKSSQGELIAMSCNPDMIEMTGDTVIRKWYI